MSAPEPRSVLVTGGNRGIGLAVAEAFLAAGDRVTVTSRAGGGPDGALALACDVTDTAAVDAAFTAAETEHGPVEVLVSNAGVTDDTLLLRMDESSFTDVVDVNLTGAYRVTKRAAAKMLRLRRGRLIYVSSVVGLVGAPGQANYAASKAGLIGFARSVARELGSRSITANVIAPGFVETAMTAAMTEDRTKEVLASVPLARMGRAEEIAAAALYLASPAAAYVTGVVLPVDGGVGMGI